MYAILPLKYLGISQGCNGSVSHQGLNAIDFGWKTGYDYKNLYAPFDGTVVAVFGNTNIVAFQSNEKVEWADGTKDYMTIITCHHNDVPKVGQTFKQGEIYTHMGNKNAPLHTHLEVQKGKYQKATGTKKTGENATSLIFPNTVEPYKVLFIWEDAKFSPNPVARPYTWKVVPSNDYKVLYENELAKNKILQARLDKIKEIVNV